MDIAERGLEKHSSEPEAVGLLTHPGRQPGDAGGSSMGGLTVASLSGAGSHLRHIANGHGSRHASGELPRDGGAAAGALHEQQQQQQQGKLALHGGAADGGTGGLVEEGRGAHRPSIDGCTGGGPRAAWQRDSSDSLSFEVGLPEVPADGPLLGGPAGGGGSRRVTFLTAMLMGVALCFHSLLEGAAMGAQPTIRCRGGAWRCMSVCASSEPGLLWGIGVALFAATFYAHTRPALLYLHICRVCCACALVLMPGPPAPGPAPQQLATHLHRDCQPQRPGCLRAGQQHC